MAVLKFMLNINLNSLNILKVALVSHIAKWRLNLAPIQKILIFKMTAGSMLSSSK
jgi:hypothetical protein